MTTETSIFDRPAELPEDLLKAARERGYPQEILDRARELKVNRGMIEWWVNHERYHSRRSEKVSEGAGDADVRHHARAAGRLE